jgi:hypothetical protein
MEQIEKISLLDKNNLSEEFYFKSLLSEAYYHSLLSEANIEKIQTECLRLLLSKTEQYACGESSSVRVEVAESIMTSNLYTIGIYLKSFPCPDDAVNALLEESIYDIYNKGRNLIELKLKAVTHLYHMVIDNLLNTENYTYSSTVIGGIKGFLKLYNADFEAQEIHITADYPICNHIKNLVGIEFIEKYLEAVYYENMFCEFFSSEAIHHLLCGYDEQYQDLIFNLFEQVLTCAIGCILVETNAVNLNLSVDQVKRIYVLLSEKTRAATEIVIVDAYNKLLKELSISNFALEKYMEKALSQIISNVFNSVKIDKLERVFIHPKYFEANSQTYFSYGEKMEDEKYRDIINEIIRCRFISDKIAIIKSDIKSLADLEDLFFDANLTAEEINAVLKELDIAEIAALAKRHPYKIEFEAIDLGETEIAFRLCLNKYILSLSQEKQSLITIAIGMLKES